MTTVMDIYNMPALDKPTAELTVVDVYDIAAVLGQEFERIIDKFGYESLVGVVPKVVQVLELLEALVSCGTSGHEAKELHRELERLQQERSARYEQERRQQKELEMAEDMWREEVQDLLSQIAQLKMENKGLLAKLPLKESAITEEDPQKLEGMPEKEKQLMRKLKALVDKHRDDIQTKDHELALKNKDVEALQMQQHRLIRLNQDLHHRVGVIEAQGKDLIQQRVELEATAQAQLQKMGALQVDVMRLKRELQGWELEREVSEIAEASLSRTSGMSLPTKMMSMEEAPSNSTIKPSSIWTECGGDPNFLANCFKLDTTPSLLPVSSDGENHEREGDDDEGVKVLCQQNTPTDPEPDEDSDSLEEGSDTLCFTLQELRDVLQERNELKAQVFVLQEELAYYKSEESEGDITSIVCTPCSPPCSSSPDPPESGIRRLIFTAIMPMVAAGLIADDPTLVPIRRLMSCR